MHYLEWVCVLAVLLIVFAREEKYSGLDALAPFIFMVVVLVFAFEIGGLSRILRKLKYLGEISYSIYLNQITVLILMGYVGEKNGVNDITMFAVYLLVLIIYSHFTYRYVEIPLKKQGRNLITRLTLTWVALR